VTNWPPYHQEKVGVTGDLGFREHHPGGAQEADDVQGDPLYYLARDAAPGDTKGDGVKEIWSLAKP
jgi:predicted lipoprotein with Yx(FWY)xxD motif